MSDPAAKRCSKCGQEPVRAPGQRWGARCHAAAAKKHRANYITVPRVPCVTSIQQVFEILRAAETAKNERRRRKL